MKWLFLLAVCALVRNQLIFNLDMQNGTHNFLHDPFFTAVGIVGFIFLVMK